MEEICNQTIPENAPETVLVGMIGPNSTSTLFHFATDQVNEDDCLLPGTTLIPLINLTSSDVVQNLQLFLYQAQVAHIVAFVGSSMSDASRATATASPLFEIPQVRNFFLRLLFCFPKKISYNS
jgi:hypothetical protein